MTSFSHSSAPVARGTRANGELRSVGAFFTVASARKLIGCITGSVDFVEKLQQLPESQTAWRRNDFSLTPGRWSRR